jgi:membrane associated rhomboid family serine protease
VIPLRDYNPTRTFPILCVLLIALNTVVFLYDQMNPVIVRQVVMTNYGPKVANIPMGILSARYAMIPAEVSGHAVSSVHPGWLTIFTAMFLHANWLHLGGNMLYLWIFGNNIEDVLGKARFLLFYLACGVGAAVLHIASGPGSTIPTIGASGAIAGLMGAYIWLYPGTKVLCLVPIFIIGMFFDLPAIVVIGQWFLLQFINSQWLGGGGMLEGGGVAYLAHVGGFLTGMLLIVLLGGRKLLPPPTPRGFDEDYNERRWWRGQ